MKIEELKGKKIVDVKEELDGLKIKLGDGKIILLQQRFFPDTSYDETDITDCEEW